MAGTFTQDKIKEQELVLDGMKKLINARRPLIQAIMDHHVLAQAAKNEAVPSDVRSILQKYADQWEKVEIPKIIESINNLPNVPQKARDLLISPGESTTKMLEALAMTEGDISTYEALIKKPELRRAGEMSVAAHFLEIVDQKLKSENVSRSHLLMVGPVELKMAIIKAALATNAADRNTVRTLRRESGNSKRVNELLKSTELTITIAMMMTAKSGTNQIFPASFREKMGDKVKEMEELSRSLRPEEPKDQLVMDFGRPRSEEEALDNMKAVIEKLRKEALSERTSKDKREVLVAYIIGLEKELETQTREIELAKKGQGQGLLDAFKGALRTEENDETALEEEEN